MILRFVGAAWRRRCTLAGAAVMLVLSLMTFPVQAAIPAPLAHYDLRVDLNLEAAYLTAVESVSYTNSTSETLSSLVFNIPASFFGGFALADVTVDGDPVRVVVEKQSAEIPLPRPLFPDGRVTVVLHFRQDLPPSDGRYGFAAGTATLGDWYPMLAVYRNGWVRAPYSDIGDPFFSDVADYDVFLATSTPATVLATGEVVSNNGKYWHFRSRQARDFALVAGARYKTLSRVSDGVTVTVAFLPEQAAGASRSLDIAVDTLRWYSSQVGTYPYKTLGIAVTLAQRPVHTAQEHTGIVFLRSDTVEGGGYYLDILTAHEVAHQWFYGVVGSDQLNDPWLDEALVNAMALDFFRQRNGEAYQSMWEGWGNYSRPGVLNRSIYDFQKGTAYFDEIYRRGATFMREMQTIMGSDAYWSALREYYSVHRFRLATPQEFLLTMRVASGADLMTLYRNTFDFAFLREPDPQITATVPSQIVAGDRVTMSLRTNGTEMRFKATLDGQPAPVSDDLLTLGPSVLSTGGHVLLIEAFGAGVGYARQEYRFTVAPAPPTPTSQPPVTVTPRFTPVPVAVPGAPSKPVSVTEREAAWVFLAWLALAAMAGLGSALSRAWLRGRPGAAG